MWKKTQSRYELFYRRSLLVEIMLFPHHAPIFNHRKFAFIAWCFAYLPFFFFLISRSFHELELVVMHFAFDSSSLLAILLSYLSVFRPSLLQEFGKLFAKAYLYEVISWVKLILLTFFPLPLFSILRFVWNIHGKFSCSM